MLRAAKVNDRGSRNANIRD